MNGPVNLAGLSHIGRGIEREALKMKGEDLYQKEDNWGSPLTHKWITLDYAASLVELVTQVQYSNEGVLSELLDIQRYCVLSMGNRRFWPASMPPRVPDDLEIELADFGPSLVGQLKTAYRRGLTTRYGSRMQIIAGIHYNISFPMSLWEAAKMPSQSDLNAQYLGMIRNFYRTGWILPYLFGASPAVSKNFWQPEKDSSNPNQENPNPEELDASSVITSREDFDYYEYATCLRMSDLGYTQKHYSISLNDLDQYCQDLQTMTQTPEPQFQALGEFDAEGHRHQLSTHILQIENELYAPIRPKRVTLLEERPSEALQARGIEYVECRCMDVDPYSAVGITEETTQFLDVYLTWCFLEPSPPLCPEALKCHKETWNLVCKRGRQPNLELSQCNGSRMTVAQWGAQIMADLQKVARQFDEAHPRSAAYVEALEEIAPLFSHPERTPSARFLGDLLKDGWLPTHQRLAKMIVCDPPDKRVSQ